MDWISLAGGAILALGFGLLLLHAVRWWRGKQLDRPHLRYSPGIEVAFWASRPDVWVISGIHPESPAFRAGLRLGDELMAVNGHLIHGVARSRVEKLLRSPSNGSALFTVRSVHSGAVMDHCCSYEYLEWPLSAKDRLESSRVSPPLLVSGSTRMTNGMVVSRRTKTKHATHRLTDGTIDSSL